jgi:hypothetical protein
MWTLASTGLWFGVHWGISVFSEDHVSLGSHLVANVVKYYVKLSTLIESLVFKHVYKSEFLTWKLTLIILTGLLWGFHTLHLNAAMFSCFQLLKNFSKTYFRNFDLENNCEKSVGNKVGSTLLRQFFFCISNFVWKHWNISTVVARFSSCKLKRYVVNCRIITSVARFTVLEVICVIVYFIYIYIHMRIYVFIHTYEMSSFLFYIPQWVWGRSTFITVTLYLHIVQKYCHRIKHFFGLNYTINTHARTHEAHTHMHISYTYIPYIHIYIYIYIYICRESLWYEPTSGLFYSF